MNTRLADHCRVSYDGNWFFRSAKREFLFAENMLQTIVALLLLILILFGSRVRVS